METKPFKRPNSQNGSESIAPETISVDEILTFTLNLNPSTLLGGFNNQYDKYIEKLKNLVNSHMDITGTLEYSQFGKLHFHGTLKFRSPLGIGLFYSKLAPVCGKHHYKIDTVEPGYECSDYYLKGKFYMKPLHKKFNKTYLLTNAVLNSPSMIPPPDHKSNTIALDSI